MPYNVVLECDDCQRQLVDRRRNGRDTLFRHFLRMHAKLKKEDRLACDECHWTFGSRNHLQRHIFTNHRITLTADDVVICEQCSQTFKAKHLLHRHIKTRHPTNRPEGNYGCAECDFQISKDRQRLVAHLSRKHGLLDADYRCRQCRIKFNNYTSLFQHRLVMHAKRMFKCDDCDDVFVNRSSLANHTLYKHLLGHRDVNWICELCERRFEQKGQLKAHVVGYHWRSWYRYRCDECSNVTTSKSELAIHVFRHLQVQLKFDCDQCDLTWSRLQALEQHRLSEHGDARARPICDRCCRSFANRAAMAAHYETQHLWETTTMEVATATIGENISADLPIK